MNVLEKILEEIEEMRNIMESTVAMDCFGKDCEHDDCTVCVCERAMEIIRSHMDEVENDDWIPCSKRLPEQGRWVFATVMHSAWISDYDSEWVKEEEKIHHKKSFGTYLAYINTFGEWIFLDEESETICEKEIGNDPGELYDVAIAWKPLPEPYRAADSKPDWKENMLNTFLAGH